MRISSAALLLALPLAACSENGSGLPADGPAIECAIDGGAGFAADCTMERHTAEEGDTLIVRHPDGAFRRFELGVPGRGIITADGVEVADVTNHGGYVEVRVGSDRYRLPVAE